MAFYIWSKAFNVLTRWTGQYLHSHRIDEDQVEASTLIKFILIYEGEAQLH